MHPLRHTQAQWTGTRKEFERKQKYTQAHFGFDNDPLKLPDCAHVLSSVCVCACVCACTLKHRNVEKDTNTHTSFSPSASYEGAETNGEETGEQTLKIKS